MSSHETFNQRRKTASVMTGIWTVGYQFEKLLIHLSEFLDLRCAELTTEKAADHEDA